MSRIDRFLTMDRRWIFLFVGLALCVPVLFPFEFPGLEVSEPTRRHHDRIETLPEGAPILISCDFDPASSPELKPMLDATLRHAFKRRLRVFVMSLMVTGSGLAEQTLNEQVVWVKENWGLDPRYGEDFVFLGWKSSDPAMVIGMGEDLRGQFDGKDAYEKGFDYLPAMKGIRRVADFDLLVSFCAGTYWGHWVMYAVDKYDLNLVGGCTGVLATEAYPYYNAGQLRGFMAGMKGAAEYEKMLGVEGTGRPGMTGVSIAHLTTFLLIVVANVLYLVSRRRKGGEATR